MAKYYFQILLYSLSISLCFLFPQTSSLNFNLTNIGEHVQKVKTFGTAYFSSRGLELTSNKTNSDRDYKDGGAAYVEPLQLWYKTTRKLADFNTSFVFVVNSEGEKIWDDFRFFLAPQESDLPNTDFSTVVSVEFNAAENKNVTINVNSYTANVAAVWYVDIDGKENRAWISYNSSSQVLSVVFTGSTNTTPVQDTISFGVDLRDHLPEVVRVGFYGRGWQYSSSHFQINTLKSWVFSSNLELINGTNNIIAPVHVPVVSKSLSVSAVVGLVVGSAVLVGVFVLVGFGLWRRSRTKEDDAFEVEMSMENEFESASGAKKFSFHQLSQATNNFDEGQKLGEGGFGGVYKGFLRESNSCIAVKRISKGSKQGIKEYATEVKIISRLRHRNLVQLIGWCHEKKELLLVYEFMENASLDCHLFGGRSLLTWATRYKIAQGLASALLYLHEGWEQCVVHRDVKSSNVMLDSNFHAKLGDFGLARFVDHEKEPETTLLAGTMGYLAPECVVTGKASKESDVYSFGIVALEIACGRKPLDLKVPESQMKLVEWVWDLYGMGRLLEAVDPKLGSDFDEQEIECLMIVGLWCAHPDNNFRPKIRLAAHVLNLEAPLPILPPKQPALSFFGPAPNTSTTSFC